MPLLKNYMLKKVIYLGHEFFYHLPFVHFLVVSLFLHFVFLKIYLLIGYDIFSSKLAYYKPQSVRSRRYHGTLDRGSVGIQYFYISTSGQKKLTPMGSVISSTTSPSSRVKSTVKSTSGDTRVIYFRNSLASLANN